MLTKNSNKEKSKLKTSHNNKLGFLPQQIIKIKSNKILSKIFKWIFVLTIWLGTIGLASMLYFLYDIPDLDKLKYLTNQKKITILDNKNRILANFGDLYGSYVEYDGMPTTLIQAVIATEDRRFFEHCGVDPVGLIRAAYINYKADKVIQGGSTITQQLAKIAYLKPERKFKRKIQELFLAFYLEKNFTKKQILTYYLNRVYLGSGIYGVDAAAKYYFGKDLSKINLFESAIIAGLLKAPSKYNPVRNSNLSHKRAQQVLLNMQLAGYINLQQLNNAKKINVTTETSALGILKNLYFANYLLDEIDSLSIETDQNLTIYSTLDFDMQLEAEKLILDTIDQQQQKFKVSQGSLLALDKDGAILAMVGGKNYQQSSFNRVTQAKRQPGSAFKIYSYLAALECGKYQPDTIVIDGPVKVKQWQPKNYTRNFLGAITLQEAFAKSINTVAVKLSENIGKDSVIKLAHRLGVKSKIELHPSIALGSVEMSLFELITSFSTINNEGFLTVPFGIKKITDDKNNILYKRKAQAQISSLSSQTNDQIKTLLQSVVEEGTGKNAKLSNQVAFGKTGTTQDYRDAWFLGFSQNITCGVWLGNDDNSPMNKVTGGGLPAMIWQKFMANIFNNQVSGDIDKSNIDEVYEDEPVLSKELQQEIQNTL